MQVITLATPAMLAQAQVLARSLRTHQPDWSHEVLLVGRARDTGPAAGSLHVRPAAEALGEQLDLDIDRLIARYDDDELLALLRPHALRVFVRSKPGPVLHLPASTWVVGALEPISEALSAPGMLLFPRVRGEPPDDGLAPTRDQLERAGRIDDGAMGANGAAATGFLAWWASHVEDTLGSLDGRERGVRLEDRHWLARILELAPARFLTGVLADPGCNVSKWNLHAHALRAAAGGILVDERWPLCLLNLEGFDPDRPHRLAPDASRVRVSRSPALRELCRRYAVELHEAGWRPAGARRHIGRQLADGLIYDESLCALHARAITLGEDFGIPFGETGSRAFIEWLRGPAPEGAVHGINRYVYHRVMRERPDVMHTYPDLDGPDGAEYVAWCHAFGRHEMQIPDRFMPLKQGESFARAGAAPTVAAGDANEEAASNDAGDGAGGLTAARDAAASAGGTEGGAVARAADGTPEASIVAASGDAVPAVRVTGFMSHSLGLGAAARAYAQALLAAGVPTSTVSVPLHHLTLPAELTAAYGRHGFEDLAHEGRPGFEIVAVNPDELPELVQRMGDDYFQGPRIGVWGWETNVIPARWERAFGLIDEIWVYSRFMAENIGAAVPVPVMALPPPVQVPGESPAPLRLDVPEEAFEFLFVFDYLSTIQRKNPVGLIEAFRKAFAPNEGPHLLIKTINGPLRPLAEEEVLWAAHGRSDVHVVDRSLSEAERDGLMAGCDCYVSLHRSEGFGLTLAEAMALGKPVIGTAYSGNLDFMNADNSYLVDYEIGRVGAECEIYPPDGEWAEPDLQQAAGLMRKVFERPGEGRRIGARARADIAAALSPQATGAAMRARLEHLRGQGPLVAATGGRA